MTINLENDIILEGNTTLNNVIKTLNINGNNKTINGNGQWQFLNIQSRSVVNINNITITNCEAKDGGATVKTDSEGLFTYDYVFTKVGINNITASYLGANHFSESTASITIEITHIKTVLTLNTIPDTKKDETITIRGKLVDEKGNAVVDTVKLTINGGRTTVKTDSEGVFTYNYTVTKVGSNNITAAYSGTNGYSASNATTTAKVNKLGTYITFDTIGTVTQKTNVDIKGQLSDENGNGICGTVKLIINSGRATVKTDNSGAFTYTYNATRAGENTIKANYIVSDNYEASESITTFTVEKG